MRCRVNRNEANSISDRVLISATDLAERIGAGEPTVLLDVRWKLGGPPGHESYLAGHLPGAVYVDLDTELAAPPTAVAGRHPLPELAQLQQAARRWGLRAASTVVVYDDDANLAAARAWWLLRWASMRRVWLLDGGLAAWRPGAGLAARSTLTTCTPRPAMSNWWLAQCRC
jgi:thiosulfate/3-mercaptopyruvate sulfurtransferase